MDIDGVVLRGGDVIPGSADAVKALQANNIPYAFMTNGGGVTEEKKAKQLEALLGMEGIGEERVLLSHTPMKALVEKYKNRRVIIVGSKETPAVAAHYGFDFKNGWAITPMQLAAGTPHIYPPAYGKDVGFGLPRINVNEEGAPPIEAVMIFHDPIDWSLELQVLTDVIAGGYPLGNATTAKPWKQAVEVFASNPDFIWQAGYGVPRYGQGAFSECLRALWQRLSGSPLEITEFGKPMPSQFQLAQELMADQLKPGEELQRIYMMGDNPAADIRGANDADKQWRSVLVCTGVYRGGPEGNDCHDPAWRVEKNLQEAVESLLKASEQEHLAH